MNSTPLLVDVAWLSDRLKDVRLLDARAPMKYAQTHLPGAVNFPALSVTQARPDKVRVLADATQLEQLIQAAGIHEDTHVVIYGERGSQEGAFLFWALEMSGHQHLSLLNGGLEAWARAGYPLTQEAPAVQSGTFRVKIDSAGVVTGDWLLTHLNDENIQIVDNRSMSEYTGEDALAARGGHIPGAVRFEWLDALHPDLTFRSSEELKELLAKAGVQPVKKIINYCQSGARSAHAALAMKLAGWTDVRVYEASWAEWGNHKKFPVEMGILTKKKESLKNQDASETESLDLRGELCPYTLIDTKKKLSELSAGTALEVWIDNEDATQTIPQWAEQAGHEVLKLERLDQGWKIVLKKAKQ